MASPPPLERWRQIDALFAAALDLPPAEREPFLERECGEDAELRREVRLLLEREAEAARVLGESADDFAGALLDEVRDELARVEAGPLAAGGQVGPYRVLRELGRGGMGEVYLAERADGEFERRVALKLVKRGMDTAEVVARFQHERRILATLEHPYIARLYDAGASADGRPYLAMEYVEGEPIDAWCDRGRLGVDERLALFARVCRAVQYAHQRLVVHRDLKPSNILVSAAGEPKLLDFGIAKLLDTEGEGDGSPRTRTGVRILTPEYASPEQMRGAPVTTASDVYQLGVLLYQLLTGHRPEISAVALPERPSAAVLHGAGRRTGDPAGEAQAPAMVAAARGTTPERLARRLRGDLDTIVLAALEPEPDRRYGSAQQLLDDLERYRSGQPILARPSGAVYHLRKFVRRHRTAVAAAAVVLLSLTGGLGTALWQADRAVHERNQAQAARTLAERERDKAAEVTAFVLSLFEAPDPFAANFTGSDTLRVHHLLDRGAERLHRHLTGQPLLQAEMLAVLGRVNINLARYDRARALLDSALVLQGREAGAERERAVTLGLLAMLLKETGEYAPADSLLRELVALYDTRAWPPDSLYITSLSERGSVLGFLARFDEAAALHRTALELTLADGVRDTQLHARVLNSYAIHRYDLGEYAAAEPLFRDAIEITRRLHGPLHAHLAANLNNLASSVHYQERLEEAEPLYQEAISVGRQTLGAEHPLVGLYLQNLATLYDDQGAYDRAEPIYRESLRIHEAAYGRGSPNTAMLIRNLALNRHSAGRLAEAETLQREVHGSLAAALGDDHLYTALAAVSLGRTLTARGRAREALGWIVPARSALDAQLPAGHWLRAIAQRDQGGALLALGEFVQAEPLLVESFAALRRERGEANSSTREAGDHLVRLYTRLDRPEEAHRYRAPPRGASAPAEG